MKKNILPFGIIAIVGIFAAIIIFYVGVDQRKDIQQAEENGGEENEESMDEGEEVFQQNCATCHGDDLSGGNGPDLTKVGSEMSKDDIHDIIENGRGDMPAGVVEGEDADIVAEWLSEYDEDGDSSGDNNDESSENNSGNNNDNGESDNNESASADDTEEIFQSNCATCHGDDLSGDTGPDLTKIGDELSEDEIHDVIDNGQGAMPAGLVEGEEADELAKWLSEMK